MFDDRSITNMCLEYFNIFLLFLLEVIIIRKGRNLLVRMIEALIELRYRFSCPSHVFRVYIY